MDSHVLDLRDIDRTRVALVGGKAAQLGELSRMEDVRVPAGFCVTTRAFERILAQASLVDDRLDRLSRLSPDDRDIIQAISREIRAAIETVGVPDDLAAAIDSHVTRLGRSLPYAVRSSATAEDLPSASFAGQQDTYLNVLGTSAILTHVSRCWASLFTERAVSYRMRNGFDHRDARMAVIVQHTLVPQVSGVLFTADPVTGHRRIASIEAIFGLGEALVGGLVNADVYKVRDDEVVARTICLKHLAIDPSPGGGTNERAVAPDDQQRAALTDAQAVQIARLGTRIAAHFSRPQDIEWCLVDGEVHVVQSRPITTAFPVPAATDDANRVYLSVGHQQMMTDPMRPLGLSFWQLTTRATMCEAGGRLFVDVTRSVESPARRGAILAMLDKADPLTGDALRNVLERDDFVPLVQSESPLAPHDDAPEASIESDAAIVHELIAATQASLAASRRDIQGRSGPTLLAFIRRDLEELQRVLFDSRSHQAIMAAVESTWALNEKLFEWLGEKNAADTLAQSAPGNVTAEMGLALLDVADAIRPHPSVVSYLRDAKDENVLEHLSGLPGGREARDAIRSWLERYGMRCPGEIDITRPRWSERPSTLVPLILANVTNFEPGERVRRLERGMREARSREQNILRRLRDLPDGGRKADEAKRSIDRVRTFIGFREYPKYGMISRYFVYKQALMEEADRLAVSGVLREAEDIFYLGFEELEDAVRTQRVDDELIRRRKDEFRSYRSLQPPRVLTSEGEAVAASYRRGDVPPGALAGLPVSAGTVDGRARVITDMTAADLELGDILVTTYTDPSWTPLFVAVAGLVTEVGGLMTHGSVIAREYGLPAVVGVMDATRLIRDGQRIRVHGSEGYVEILGPLE